jgi:dihydroflavonol-4-reductase
MADEVVAVSGVRTSHIMATLVTGGSGFIGSAVVRKLLERRHDVRVLVRKTSQKSNLEGLSIDIAVGDLTDRASLCRAIRGCDTVFHVAADYRLWVPQAAQMMETNVNGTRNLMEMAGELGVRRIIYTSSVATLGLSKDAALADEETPVSGEDMIGPYKQSKFRAEALVREMVAKQGLPVVIVNPSTPIGPRDIKPTPTGKIVVEAASGRMPAFVDTGLNVVHVDDVAEGHVLALEHGIVGQRYILGGQNLTLEEILKTIATLTRRRPPRMRVPHDVVVPMAAMAELVARLTGKEPFATLDGVKLARKKMFFSSEHAMSGLGYRPRPAEEAIADAVSWFQQHNYLH